MTEQLEGRITNVETRSQRLADSYTELASNVAAMRSELHSVGQAMERLSERLDRPTQYGAIVGAMTLALIIMGVYVRGVESNVATVTIGLSAQAARVDSALIDIAANESREQARFEMRARELDRIHLEMTQNEVLAERASTRVSALRAMARDQQRQISAMDTGGTRQIRTIEE